VPEFLCKCGRPTERKGRPCPSCACGARNKNSRGLDGISPTCTQWPIDGGKRCKMHGGGTPQARKAAARNVAERKARKTLAEVGEFAPVENPLTELAQVAGRARAFMEILQSHVERLEDLSQGNLTGPDAARVELQLYERAMDRTGRLVEALAKLNIDERLVTISERQADAVIAAIDAALTAVGIRDPDLRQEAKRVAGRHLTAVS
jgi:hypothetical protein